MPTLTSNDPDKAPGTIGWCRGPVVVVVVVGSNWYSVLPVTNTRCDFERHRPAGHLIDQLLAYSDDPANTHVI